ncbi:amidohydrolase family protein [Streptomyces sp. NPDC001848]|uniref:amidohydrolase family protein n=1 Tax=Streptomyces sp. NPDC001848 TaxID=3364618 RepID=UPI00368F7AA5
MTKLLITAGHLLFGTDDEYVEDGAVLISDRTVVAAGRRATVEKRAGQDHRVLSFPDATLLPGLIDCHVHLAFDGSPDPVAALRASDDATLFEGMARRAERLLDFGVTTVRDLGDRGGLAVRLRDEIAAGRRPGPRVVAAGTPLTSPQGHCWFLGGEVQGPDRIRDAVRAAAQQGADLIKVMATGGGLTSGGPAVWETQFTPEELAAAVDEARRAGLPVAAHAHGTAGIADVIAAGVNTIEHCTWMGKDGSMDLREDLLAQLVAKDISVCPASHPNWRSFAERVGPERARELFAPARRMAERRVRLIAGTDAGVPRSGVDGLVAGLEFFEYIGLSRTEAIACATVEAARALGLAHDTGRLRPGYRADLIVVGGNPLDDLNALRDIRLVLANGLVHSPGQADAKAGCAGRAIT